MVVVTFGKLTRLLSLTPTHRDYVSHEVKDALTRLGGMLPMNIFLRQEIDRMQKIITLGEGWGGEEEGTKNFTPTF